MEEQEREPRGGELREEEVREADRLDDGEIAEDERLPGDEDEDATAR